LDAARNTANYRRLDQSLSGDPLSSDCVEYLHASSDRDVRFPEFALSDAISYSGTSCTQLFTKSFRCGPTIF
jgi:hypothetical protein